MNNNIIMNKLLEKDIQLYYYVVYISIKTYLLDKIRNTYFPY